MSARRVATQVLFRVVKDGAWAAPTLDAELRRARLDPREAALATDMVYGALRVLPELDGALDRYLKQPTQTDPFLRAALRIGAYQLLHLSRIPVHAAVSETVSVVRAERGARLAGVANAVLRKVAQSRPENPTPADHIVVPPWVERALGAGLGADHAAAFLKAQGAPPLGLRVVRGSTEALRETIRHARERAEVVTSELVDGALQLRGAGDPRTLPGYDEGDFAVQELGSQYVTQWVGAKPGERIADLCCGHGTKTLALAQRVGDAGSVDAVDLYEEKLERLQAERERLKVPASRVRVHAIDLTAGTGALPHGHFDRVLVDAPCTGLGTLRRRPELVLRLKADDPARMGQLQRALLVNALKLVRPGGTLVFVTCSGAHEEGPAIAQDYGAQVLTVGPWLGEMMDVYQAFRVSVP